MGVLLLIHPETGSAVCILPGEGALARDLILDGFNPVGPRGMAAAEELRRRHAETHPNVGREVRDGEW